MKTIRTALLFTLALYAAVWGAFLLDARSGFSRSADNQDQFLVTFVFSALIIGVFFIRTVYQAITVDESYWLVAVLHVLFTFLIIYYFSTTP